MNPITLKRINEFRQSKGKAPLSMPQAVLLIGKCGQWSETTLLEQFDDPGGYRGVTAADLPGWKVAQLAHKGREVLGLSKKETA